MLCGSLVLNVEASLTRICDLFVFLLSYLPSATTSYPAVDGWSSTLKKACQERAIFSYDCLGTYLLPPLHVLCGLLVLNVEECLSRSGDLFR
jgi:hypothetical protein